MPRVVNPPQKSHGRGSSKQATTPHKNSPMKIPLNDDAGEKVARFQSRQALHDLQMNQIKAAVKTPMPPMRKINSYERASSSSPRTPRGSSVRVGGRETDSGGRQIVNGRAVTPMKRVPILANFEEWMKMATDNKINAANSWNFALIDYFHDMSLLKEGDGVNFQKASCTLDGCVKIYTSRVDSVATETGKLLSGLADSNNKKRQPNEGEGGEGDDDEEDETGEDGVKIRKQRKTRSHENTLAPSFSSLQLKKFELEFSVDPLFKKASADFDEGGAKGLLLNHLSIDGTGRIVFDSSDDAGDATADGDWNPRKDSREGTAETDAPSSPSPAPPNNDWDDENVEVDLGPLANKFFSSLDILDEQDICPSLKDFDLGDPSGLLDIPFLRAPDDWRQDKSQLEPGVGEASGIMLDDDIAVGFDDDDATITGFDLGGDTGFGEGGEAWARDAALEPMLKVHRIDDGDEGMDSDSNDPYTISLSHQSASKEHDNILSYFDNALQKNWAGPEHWKIRRIKETTTPANAAPRIRKEKEPFEIDFASPLDPTLAEIIYTQSSSNSAISLPKTQWKTKGRNLLPDDKHFNSRELLRLFLKPKARMGFKSLGRSRQNRNQQNISNNSEMDEAFWAAHKSGAEQTSMDEGAAPTGAYDANFFADDEGLAFPHGLPMGGDDDDDNMPFADAREAFSPAMDPNAPPSTSAGGLSGLTALLHAAATPGGALAGAGGFGSQLVTQGGRRVRPEYVAYARVAKKVDVRRLKEEMWKGMGDRLITSSAFNSSSPSAAVTSLPALTSAPQAKATESPTPASTETIDPTAEDAGADGKNLRFTSVMKGLKSAYPEQTLRDISTSYCFICLLHLANEKGLVLENKGGMDGWEGDGLEEIYVSKDAGAVIEGEV
ncbi:condensin complex subunit 2 [[Emmonsia] crescens]|uniref:Condensin complex subunit 2 n=1 Tax=[Emmonsia] crescens TaxID=73230 RepID=A0A0G2J363_9EURO|nr:condensin complex subunit 2 [Emmonsia crescens UAMH 3008]